MFNKTNTGIILAMAAGSLFGTASASANTPAPQVSDLKFGDAALSVSAQDTLTVEGKTVLQLRFEMAKGLPKKKMKQCKKTKDGQNSYIDKVTGKRVWLDWEGKTTWICKDKTSSTGWRKVGNKKKGDEGNCGNEFNPEGKKEKKVYTGEYEATRSAALNVTYTMKAELDGLALVACEANGVSAMSMISAHGIATATVTIKVKSRTQIEAEGEKLKVKNREKLTIEAQGDATVKFWGSASALCVGNSAEAVDNAPSIEILGAPAHLYVNGNAQVFFEAWDPDGDQIAFDAKVTSGSGWIAGRVEVDKRWDNTPCPVGRKCYRATVWAGATPGPLTITATVTSKDKTANTTATFPVMKDEF